MAYTVKRTSGPTVEPVTVAEAQAHLGVTGDDTLIASLIATAREAAEAYTRRAFTTSTFELVLDGFPFDERVPKRPWWLDTAFSFASAVDLPNPPLQSVSSVVVFDYENSEETVPADSYFVNTRSEPGSIVPRQLSTWPTEVLPEAGVVITYDAGYGDATDVPAAIKHAILLEVANLYGRRNPSVASESIDNASVTYVNESTAEFVGGTLSPMTTRVLRPYRVLRL